MSSVVVFVVIVVDSVVVLVEDRVIKIQCDPRTRVNQIKRWIWIRLLDERFTFVDQGLFWNTHELTHCRKVHGDQEFLGELQDLTVSSRLKCQHGAADPLALRCPFDSGRP